MADIRSRIQLLEAMSANYQDLLGFARTANAIPDRSANMATLVENLARTVPEVSAVGPASQTATIPPDPSRAPYGIVGMVSHVATMARKERGKILRGPKWSAFSHPQKAISSRA